MTKNKKKGAIIVAGMFTASSVIAMSGSIENVFASNKSTLKAAQDYTSYLKSTLSKNYLGAKNLPAFNQTLQSAKSAVAKLPKGDTKNKLSASVSRSESIIRATESLVKLEESMSKNAHIMRNVPVFEIYLNKSSNLIGRLSHAEVQGAKDKLSPRNYKMFNEVRDIKVKNTSQYAYALQLYYEGKMFHNIAKENPTPTNVKLADDKISDALNAVWKITTSAIKDKLRDDVKAILKEQSKLPGSTIPNGGGSGNGGTGSTSKPQIILSGNIYMKIKLNEKYKEPGYAAIDEKDGIITHKVKVSYMNIVTGETYDTLPVNKSATFQIKYTVIDSDKNQEDVYRFIAVGNASLPNTGGSGDGGSGDGDSPGGDGDVSNDKTPPTIKLLGDVVTFVKFGSSFTDKGINVTDNVDTTSNIKITKEYLYNGTKLPSGQTINTSKSGSYTIIYTATDRAGNSSSITRTVIVEELNADTNGALTSLSIEKTIPIPIDLNKANLPSGIEIKYIQDTNIVDIEAVAASSKATVEIIGDRGTIGSPQLGSVKYVGSISGNSTITIKVTPFMGQDVKVYKIELTPIAGDNKPAIADAILKAKTKGEVYKLLSGAFGEESGIINPSWADFYIKDNYETGMPGLVITKGTTLNAVYGEKGNAIVFGSPITTSDYNAIMKYVYAVNSFQIGKMDANAKDRYTQSLVTSAVQKYQENDDSNVKYNQLAHSIGKEYLFDIIDIGSSKDKVYESLKKYIEHDKNCKAGILKDYNGNDIKTGINIGIDFATNLTNQPDYGLNEYLKDEYLEVLSDTAGSTLGAIREKIYANVKGLTVGGKYPRIDMDIVYTANDKAISNAISKLSAFNDGSKINEESTPKEILDTIISLRNKTSHRTGTYVDNSNVNREWKFEFDDKALVKDYTYQEGDPVNTSNYYFLDINYKSYAKELAKLKGTVQPYAVREAIEEGNKVAKALNETIITTFKNSAKDNKPKDMVESLNEMCEKITNANTKLFKSSNPQVKEEIAEKLIKIINKKETAKPGFRDKLTIKQVIDYINPSSIIKDDEKNLLQKAVDMHKAHIVGFDALANEIINSKKYEDYKPNPGGSPSDNSGQWAIARGELTSKIDAYIGKISSEYGNTETEPDWISDYQSSSEDHSDPSKTIKNKEKIAHFILSKKYENEDRKQLLNSLKNKTTIKDGNEAMKNLITKALAETIDVTTDEMNGPQKTP